ncbi:MAG: nucleotidyltransferase substrate binding protein [Verrucomicrobiales bacterium]
MPPNPDVRWRQRFQNFKLALLQLQEAVALASERDLSKLERQGLIQAFEFTHELAWNTLKDYLEASGATGLFGSVKATRSAFAAGIIEDGEAWMEMIKHRNLTTHTYDQRTAEMIAAAVLDRYAGEFEKMRAKFVELESENE